MLRRVHRHAHPRARRCRGGRAGRAARRPGVRWHGHRAAVGGPRGAGAGRCHLAAEVHESFKQRR
ncbi:hypothetical protein ISF6_3558 [Piscinibacter sakaiensis]|uniref:Uncharacterized protein n=1 Tax=Piscinibacter sakaiensis TaxID=1547922 RepID=A0A0K8P4L3_PISS1|nr:hypothetical protein ISF6_3558 [Piscinibacter sakaiensis]